jgi:hypothetical protein
MADGPFRIVPSAPAFDASGTPYSPEYGDVYHSADSGPGRARHGTCSWAGTTGGIDQVREKELDINLVE